MTKEKKTTKDESLLSTFRELCDKTQEGTQTLEDMIQEAVNKQLEVYVKDYFNNNYIHISTSRNEHLQAVHGVDFLLVLWDLEAQLREFIKWNNGQLSAGVIEGYEDVRILIRDFMEKHNVSFDMLE